MVEAAGVVLSTCVENKQVIDFLSPLKTRKTL
jgi:hypothetical protein